MKIIKILFVFAFFAVSVVGVSALASRSQVESELIRTSRKILRVNGLEQRIEVSFRGRNCILTGEVATQPEREHVLELLSTIEGVYAWDADELLVSAR